MKIAVIGAGAIGALVAGYLKEKGQDVFLVGHKETVDAIAKNGLEISGVRGRHNINIEIFEKLNKDADLVILAVKTQDIDEVAKDNIKFLKNATILTTQNGVQADKIISRYVPKENIISSIVMFGSTYKQPAKIVHNFEQKWVIGRIFSKNDAKVSVIAKILENAFSIVIADNILGMKYLKIFLNANNCLPAILGGSMQEAFKNLDICRISILIWKEGLEIVDKAKIKLESLPDFSVDKLRALTSMPLDQAANIFSGIMNNLSKEPLYGSILQSIQRNRVSEIDYLNGEFVNLAESLGLKAPLNQRLVEMVHTVETNKQFLSVNELINLTKEVAR